MDFEAFEELDENQVDELYNDLINGENEIAASGYWHCYFSQHGLFYHFSYLGYYAAYDVTYDSHNFKSYRNVDQYYYLDDGYVYQYNWFEPDSRGPHSFGSWGHTFHGNHVLYASAEDMLNGHWGNLADQFYYSNACYKPYLSFATYYYYIFEPYSNGGDLRFNEMYQGYQKALKGCLDRSDKPTLDYVHEIKLEDNGKTKLEFRLSSWMKSEAYYHNVHDYISSYTVPTERLHSYFYEFYYNINHNFYYQMYNYRHLYGVCYR